MSIRICIALALAAWCSFQAPLLADDAKVIRIGIIGLDTSHAPAFAKELNNPQAKEDVAGCKVVAAYPKGSPDIESSVSRVPKYTEDLKALGVEIVDSIDVLLTKVDAVLLETNDGRPHLEQAIPVIKAGKPLFIDKPIAGSLVKFAALDGVPGDPAHPKRTSIRFDEGDGALLAWEVERAFEAGPRAGFGVWRYTARFERTRDAVAGVPGPLRRGNGGFYSFVESPLWREAGGEQGLAGFLRVGFADDRVNPFSSYVGAGAVRAATRISSASRSRRRASARRTATRSARSGRAGTAAR